MNYLIVGAGNYCNNNSKLFLLFTPAPTKLYTWRANKMVTNLTTAKEVFTEFESIKGNVKTFCNYNSYIIVETTKDGFLAGKPEKYTFSKLNLLRLFYSLLLQLQ